jgi:anaphase-promoting complex subunit 1
MFRCALRQSPSSSLANDCITALAEGLGSSFYRHFLGLIWKDDYSTDLSEAESSVDSEWDSFCRVIMKMCRKSNIISQKHSGLVPHCAWNFLLSSQFHNNFCKVNSLFGKSSAVPLDQVESSSSTLSIDGKKCSEEPFYTELLIECLESLHALYESLKLDNLRKRYVFTFSHFFYQFFLFGCFSFVSCNLAKASSSHLLYPSS